MKEFFKNHWKEVLMIILFVIIILLVFANRNSSQETQRWKDNYYITQDSLNVVTTKNGELIYERDLYQLNYNELNEEYQKRVKELEKELNKSIKYISKIEGNIKIDTLVLRDSVWISDNITHVDFSYNDSWMKLKGSTILGKDTNTYLNSLYIDVPLVVSISDEKSNSIFVTTENPYITFSSIEGVVLDKTPNDFKHWTWRALFGMDLNRALINNTTDIIPYIESDISYKFYNNVFVGGRIGLNVQTNIQRIDVCPYIGAFVGYSLNF